MLLRISLAVGYVCLGFRAAKCVRHESGWENQRWVAISDGGSGLEEFLRVNFPRVEVVILDFYHAAEYLGAIGRAWHPSDEEASKAWSAQWCHELKHSGGESVLTKLRALAGESIPSGVVRAFDDATRYFENQKHRIDYPRYRASG
jgi:hypothetical protein